RAAQRVERRYPCWITGLELRFRLDQARLNASRDWHDGIGGRILIDERRQRAVLAASELRTVDENPRILGRDVVQTVRAFFVRSTEVLGRVHPVVDGIHET